jgi:hypothetical protein
MLVLSLLVIACVSDAHIATAFAGDQATVETICGVGLPMVKGDVNPSGLQSLAPRPSPVSQSPSLLLHGPVLASSTLEQSFFPNGSWPQDPLHALVHVFLF